MEGIYRGGVSQKPFIEAVVDTNYVSFVLPFRLLRVIHPRFIPGADLAVERQGLVKPLPHPR